MGVLGLGLFDLDLFRLFGAGGMDDFICDVEFFHVEAEGEAGLRIDGRGGVIDDGCNGH